MISLLASAIKAIWLDYAAATNCRGRTDRQKAKKQHKMNGGAANDHSTLGIVMRVFVCVLCVGVGEVDTAPLLICVYAASCRYSNDLLLVCVCASEPATT